MNACEKDGIHREEILDQAGAQLSSSSSEAPLAGGELNIPGATLDEIEKIAILKTYEYCEGSSSKTAELLGVNQRKIQYKLKHYRNASSSA